MLSTIPNIAALADSLDGQLYENELMSKYTSFRIGGLADIFVDAASAKDVVTCHAYASDNGLPIHIIGNGSNLLVADSGLRGVTVRIGKLMSDVQLTDGNRMLVQAGASNAKVAAEARQAGLSGYEFAAGIPGTIGGAAVMNAGAYGGEFSDVCRMVVALNLASGDVIELPPAEMEWGYRTSSIMERGLVVLSAELELVPEDPDVITAKMRGLAGKRATTQPHVPSAGSTFKRCGATAASELIDRAGLKGMHVGGAEVSEEHAGFIVNEGGATADDVRQLMALVIGRVEDRFGTVLVPEIKMLGFAE